MNKNYDWNSEPTSFLSRNGCFLLWCIIFLLNLALLISSGYSYGKIKIRKEAIENNVGYWEADKKTGIKEFKWIKLDEKNITNTNNN